MGAPQSGSENRSVTEATSSEHLRGSQGNFQTRPSSTKGSPLVVNVLNNAARDVTVAASCHKPNYTLRPGEHVRLEVAEADRFWLIGEDTNWDCRSHCNNCFYLMSRFDANHTMEANVGFGALDAALEKATHDAATEHLDPSNSSDGDNDEGEDDDDEASDGDGNTNETISGVELVFQFPSKAEAAERTATCTRHQCDLERLASSGGNLTLVVHGSESRHRDSDTDNATIGHKKGLAGNSSHDVMLKGSWDDHHHWNPRRRDWDRRRRDWDQRRRDWDPRRRSHWDERRRDWDRRRRSHWDERRRRSHGGGHD